MNDWMKESSGGLGISVVHGVHKQEDKTYNIKEGSCCSNFNHH